MKKTVPNVPEESCNTEGDSSLNACKHYAFTYNNYPKELNELNNVLNVLGNYIYGFEVGEKGTPHLQGYINLHKKARITTLKRLKGLETIHWEACKKHEQANIAYCKKDGNYVSNFLKEKKPLKILKEEQLYTYQKKILNYISEEPDDRTINWVYDPIGKRGKTQFAKFCIVKTNAIVATAGDAKDIANLIKNAEDGGRDLNDNTTFIFNLSRKGHVSYAGLEGVKDGLLTNIKYEAKQLVFNSPHVWVLSNELPERHKLSEDRWSIWTIDETNDLAPYGEAEDFNV